MLKKILVPLDGSDVSESVLASALLMARCHQAEVLLIRVVPHLAEMAPGLAPERVPELQQKAIVRARNYLENRSAQFAPGVVYTHTKLGLAREEVPALARLCACDLILMASHGRDGAQHWLLGSVAEGILRRSPCPVLLVRPQASPSANFRHILVPVDGSPASLAVLPVLADLLAPEGKVTLLQSSGVSLYPNFAHKALAVQSYLEEAEARLREIHCPGLPMDVVVTDGEPVEDILSWSQANDCDLIAMTSHGRGGFQRFLLGSVSEKVARHALCNVLMAPHVEH